MSVNQYFNALKVIITSPFMACSKKISELISSANKIRNNKLESMNKFMQTKKDEISTYIGQKTASARKIATDTANFVFSVPQNFIRLALAFLLIKNLSQELYMMTLTMAVVVFPLWVTVIDKLSGKRNDVINNLKDMSDTNGMTIFRIILQSLTKITLHLFDASRSLQFSSRAVGLMLVVYLSDQGFNVFGFLGVALRAKYVFAACFLMSMFWSILKKEGLDTSDYTLLGAMLCLTALKAGGFIAISFAATALACLHVSNFSRYSNIDEQDPKFPQRHQEYKQVTAGLIVGFVGERLLTPLVLSMQYRLALTACISASRIGSMLMSEVSGRLFATALARVSGVWAVRSMVHAVIRPVLRTCMEAQQVIAKSYKQKAEEKQKAKEKQKDEVSETDLLVLKNEIANLEESVTGSPSV